MNIFIVQFMMSAAKTLETSKYVINIPVAKHKRGLIRWTANI